MWGGGIFTKYDKVKRLMSMVNSNRERKRVLFVEDHEDSWEIVAHYLEEHTLFYARDFNEGLRLARLPSLLTEEVCPFGNEGAHLVSY